MKKYIIFFFICIAFFSAQPSAKAQFTLTAGYDRAQYSLNGENEGNPFDGFVGELGYTAKFMKGIMGVNLAANYAFRTRNNGEKSLGLLYANSSSQEQTISIPIRLLFDIPIKSFGLLFYGGGYAAYEISAIKSYDFNIDGTKTCIQYDYLNNKFSENDDVPSAITDIIANNMNTPSFKKYDYGLQVGAGVRIMNSVAMHASYNFGLCNRYADESLGELRKNYFNVKVSFMF